MALHSGHHEAAAALIVCGARLHGATGLPPWLQRGLDGDPTDCEQVCAMALEHVQFSI